LAFEQGNKSKMLKYSVFDKLIFYGYGITENEHDWFKSYLDQRFQKTGFNGVLSAIRKVKLGVPQGSVLISLLFVLYINEIVSAIDHSTFNLFADDTLLLFPHRPKLVGLRRKNE
jgi:hypothetical protein